MSKRTFLLSTILLSLLLLSACRTDRTAIGRLQTDEQRVELGQAERVTAEVNIGAGRLRIGGFDGDGALLQATFNYNIEAWQPEVVYEVDQGTGNLVVRQPESGARIPANANDLRYEWDLRLDRAASLNLAVSMGAGEGELDLGDLNLERFRFRGGAGKVTIDLGGSTVNDVDVTMGAGEVALDLSGDWAQDLEGAIEGGIGRLTVLLPSGAGVRVAVTGGLGQVIAEGLDQNGPIYTNAAYGQAETTLELDIEAGVGDIRLEVVD